MRFDFYSLKDIELPQLTVMFNAAMGIFGAEPGENQVLKQALLAIVSEFEDRIEGENRLHPIDLDGAELRELSAASGSLFVLMRFFPSGAAAEFLTALGEALLSAMEDFSPEAQGHGKEQ